MQKNRLNKAKPECGAYKDGNEEIKTFPRPQLRAGHEESRREMNKWRRWE